MANANREKILQRQVDGFLAGTLRDDKNNDIAIDKHAYGRILAKIRDLTAAAKRPAASPRPAASRSASIYFDTPGAVTAAPSGGLDPLPFILAAGALLFLFRR